jgi:TolB-like protein
MAAVNKQMLSGSHFLVSQSNTKQNRKVVIRKEMANEMVIWSEEYFRAISKVISINSHAGKKSIFS